LKSSLPPLTCEIIRNDRKHIGYRYVVDRSLAKRGINLEGLFTSSLKLFKNDGTDIIKKTMKIEDGKGKRERGNGNMPLTSRGGSNGRREISIIIKPGAP